METKIIFKTSRSVVIELNDGGIFHTLKPYELKVNGVAYATTDLVITGIYNLKPDTDYILTIGGREEAESITFRTKAESFSLDVRDFGAKGDGTGDDTCFIQAAIMACPPEGRVYIPEGNYRITSLFLKSNLNIELGKGAVLKAFTERERLPIMPGRIQSYDETKEYNLGTWEGNPLTMFAAAVQGINIENVVIYGEGLIDGNADSTNWWNNPRKKIIAWRPRLFFLNHCKNVIVEGVSFQNSPSWTIHPYFSQDLRFINLKIENPKDSSNTDALDPESCKNVEITGTYFSVGDDCIAIKSGKIYMGAKFRTPSENITIRQCCMRDGHGSVTLGSEMAGGVNNITVKECIFINTDRGLRIKTRRGRGKDAIIDNITFERIQMDGVMTPLVINCFYFCDPDGHTSYVQTKEAMQVDERTPLVKKLIFRNLECRNCHIAAAYIHGLPEQKIEKVLMENIKFTYAENASTGVPAMMENMEQVSKMGVYVNNVKELRIDNVTVEGQRGEAFITYNIEQIIKK